MPFKIVRNDITKMNTDAIVNTANELVQVGAGCDYAVHMAAGYDELFAYREQRVGNVSVGEAFITPGFKLDAKYIIHAVSPMYLTGEMNEDDLLRSCYQKSLALAKENGVRSIAFPLIGTGSFGYPKEEGMRIAVDEIQTFLEHEDMEIYLVVFDEESTRLGTHLDAKLEAYIDCNYVEEKQEEEYRGGNARAMRGMPQSMPQAFANFMERSAPMPAEEKSFRSAAPMPMEEESFGSVAPMADEDYLEDDDFIDDENYEMKCDSDGYIGFGGEIIGLSADASDDVSEEYFSGKTLQEEDLDGDAAVEALQEEDLDEDAAVEALEGKLNERLSHMTDTFSQYLLYLIQSKGMQNAEVYKRAIVDKKTFSKIKNNPAYHPQKITALCLCVGAKLNMDETKDLLARAGYALSPCDMTDIIFSFFIEQEHFDIIDIDIQLEQHGLPCIII